MCVLWILFDTVSQSQAALIINNYGQNVLCEVEKKNIPTFVFLFLSEQLLSTVWSYHLMKGI